jgi:hypothetical protein
MWRLLGAAVADGSLPCTALQREQAMQGAAAAAYSDLRVDMRLVQTCQLFGDHGIEVRALKGATTAVRAYRRADLRSYGDVDVLVPGSSFDRAASLLAQHGGQRRYRQARRGFDRRFSKGASFRMPDGVSVDLHRTFVVGPYGFTVDLPGVWSRRDTVTVAGYEVPCLEVHDATVHACMHAALGAYPPFLTSLRDVVEFLTTDGVDPEIVVRRAAEWRVSAVVALAVATARAVFGLADMPLASWAAGYRPARWEDRAVSVYGPGRSFRRQAVASVPFVPGLGAKVLYVAAMSFPEAAYRRERDQSHARRLRQALGALRRGDASPEGRC